MLFSSLEFLYGFLPLTLILYFCCPPRMRNGIMLALSLLFYAYGYAVEINLSSYDRTDSTLQTQATQVALTMIAALSKV